MAVRAIRHRRQLTRPQPDAHQLVSSLVGKMPSTGRTPMPSWLAVKLKKVQSSGGGASSNAHFVRNDPSPVVKAKQKRWQAKLMTMCLIALAKVAYIFCVRHVRSVMKRLRCDDLADVAEQFHHLMCFRKMDTIRPSVFREATASSRATRMPFER